MVDKVEEPGAKELLTRYGSPILARFVNHTRGPERHTCHLRLHDNQPQYKACGRPSWVALGSLENFGKWRIELDAPNSL